MQISNAKFFEILDIFLKFIENPSFSQSYLPKKSGGKSKAKSLKNILQATKNNVVKTVLSVHLKLWLIYQIELVFFPFEPKFLLNAKIHNFAFFGKMRNLKMYLTYLFFAELE